MITQKRLLATGIALAMSMGSFNHAFADAELDQLKETVALLQQQLEQVQEQLREQETKSASKLEVVELKQDVQRVAKQRSEWKDATSVVHLSGYGSVAYTDNENADGNFNQVQFAPIFHYQFADLLMLESELEIQTTADGATSTDMEYLALDLFLGDYATLVAGKFLSPIGQFRQNFHPGWINKLPSAPPGFGHDGAAPLAETGLQLRGGFPLGAARANYAVYLSNGPELEAVEEDEEMELEGVMADGNARDLDGDKALGARFGLLPLPGLEVGVSAATGKAAVTSLDGENLSSADPSRDYDVLGADLTGHWHGFDVRAEYVQTEIGDDRSAATTASEGARWKTWYTQIAYQFPPTKLEGVLRYGEFDSPHLSEDQKQWALGVNYLFAPQVIAKLAYHFNDGRSGERSDEDSLQIQMSYGF